MTSQTATGDVKFYLGDIFSFMEPYGLPRQDPVSYICVMISMSLVRESHLVLAQHCGPGLSRPLSLWKMGGYSSQVCDRGPPEGSGSHRKTWSPLESIRSYPPEIEHRYPNDGIFERRCIFQGPLFLISISKFWGVYFK